MRTKYRFYFYIIISTFLFACTAGYESIDVEKDYFTVGYYFHSTATTTKTRALSMNDENYMEDLYMLIFDKNDKYIYTTKSVSISATTLSVFLIIP